MTEIVVYGREGCEPCQRLKEKLSNACISFRYVDVNELPEDSRRSVFWVSRGVTGYSADVVPVVNIKQDRMSIWLGSYNELEPVRLFAKLKEVLGSTSR